MTDQELRLLDIRLAIAFGYKVEKATLYSPSDTLLGGEFSVHIGSVKETDAHIAETWWSLTPRFTKNMDDAMWLIETSHEKYHTDYNLFSEPSTGHHTCEFGHWADEPGRRDDTWSACEDTPALAICKAVAQCPIVMGGWAIPDKINRHWASYGKTSDLRYTYPKMDDEIKSGVLGIVKPKPNTVKLFVTMTDKEYDLLDLIYTKDQPVLDLERAGYLQAIGKLQACEFAYDYGNEGISYLRITQEGREFLEEREVNESSS